MTPFIEVINENCSVEIDSSAKLNILLNTLKLLGMYNSYRRLRIVTCIEAELKDRKKVWVRFNTLPVQLPESFVYELGYITTNPLKAGLLSYQNTSIIKFEDISLYEPVTTVNLK